ncbi:E3 ubiquitin-protein ligase NRDP1 isoform 1-T3 [Ammospiza maritima maritima]
MGYDVARFQGDVDEDLICPICSGVLEEPVQAPHCEHAFCNACITQWFSQQQTCPVDRSVVTVAHLRPVPRIMRNMLSKLQITCDNAVFGCTAVVRLDNLMAHLNDCEHNPKRPVTCEQGCGLEMPKDELPNHNCIKHLRSVVQQQQTRIAELEKTSAEHKHQLAEQKRDIQLLKAYMRAIRSVNPNLQNLEETIEYNEILEWVNPHNSTIPDPVVSPQVGELAAAGAGDALGRHDLHAGRRPSGRHQALAGGERLPGVHHQRAHRERARAQLAAGAGHAGDAADEPQILRELRGQTHPRQAGRGGDGLREPAHGRGHGAGAGARHDLRSRSGGDMRGIHRGVERARGDGGFGVVVVGRGGEPKKKNPAWRWQGFPGLGFFPHEVEEI